MALPTAGLTAHFDASDISTLFKTYVSGGAHTGVPADGDSVAVWVNTALANSIAKQFSSNPLPVYRSASPLLPRPCLDFAGGGPGTGAQLGTTTNTGGAQGLNSFITGAAHTILVAFWAETITVTLTVGYYLTQGVISDTAGYVGAFVALDAGVPKVAAYNYDGTQDYVPLPVTVGAPHVLMLRHQSGTLYASLDGGAESSVASGATTVITNTLLLGDGAGNTTFDGRIGEVAIYNTALAGADLVDALAYFTGRWLGVAPPAATETATPFLFVPA